MCFSKKELVKIENFCFNTEKHLNEQPEKETAQLIILPRGRWELFYVWCSNIYGNDNVYMYDK